MRAAQPRNSWQGHQGGRAAVLGGCCSLTPPLLCRILPGFPFPPPLVPVSQPACCTPLHKFSEQLSHLPAEPASRGPLPQRNRCGWPLCNICASSPAHFEQSCLCSGGVVQGMLWRRAAACGPWAGFLPFKSHTRAASNPEFLLGKKNMLCS